MSESLDVTATQFPVVSYQNALELARAVSEAGGARAGVGRSVIATRLGSSHKSGSFVQRLASARSYGMIEGRGTFSLTENGKRYFFPAGEEDRQKAQVAFINTPPVFAQLIKRFDGSRMPSLEMLANVLHRDLGINEQWNTRVASLFTKAAAAVGVIDSQGFLRFSALQNAPEGASGNGFNPAESTPKDIPQRVPKEANQIQSSATCGMNVWVFSLEGESVRVETSNELSLPLWQKLNSYIQVLKPVMKALKKSSGKA